MLQSIQMRNLLSFGPDSEAIPLRSLNIIIGPNGSGKSNLLEGMALLQAAPGQLVAPIREGGGIHEWLWKGNNQQVIASLEAVVDLKSKIINMPLRYRFDFTETGGGDSAGLHSQCREGFRKFLLNAGFAGYRQEVE